MGDEIPGRASVDQGASTLPPLVHDPACAFNCFHDRGLATELIAEEEIDRATACLVPIGVAEPALPCSRSKREACSSRSPAETPLSRAGQEVSSPKPPKPSPEDAMAGMGGLEDNFVMPWGNQATTGGRPGPPL